MVGEEVDAKKEVITSEDVWSVLSAAETVYVASGKKTLEYIPSSSNKDELIKKATGRTGNLRAPTVRRGKLLYVGFNQEMYNTLFA